MQALSIEWRFLLKIPDFDIPPTLRCCINLSTFDSRLCRFVCIDLCFAGEFFGDYMSFLHQLFTGNKHRSAFKE